MVAFDETYLTRTLCQMKIGGRVGLVGGAWLPASSSSCFLPLDKGDIDVKGTPKASTMLHFLGWCPSSPKKTPLSLCSMPVEHSRQTMKGAVRGKWLLLEICGKFMEQSQGTVKALVFDGHTCHVYIRKLLHGQTDDIDMDEVREIPFFKDLVYEPVPVNCLPHFPMRIARQGRDGECIWGLGGVCA